MADQSADAEAPRWLRQPGPGEARFHVAIGPGVELTPEVREALEALTSALQQDEVEGYARKPCPELGGCTPYSSVPCFAYAPCRIAS
jgi:hypothetical protein